jgi:hypothetical protein
MNSIVTAFKAMEDHLNKVLAGQRSTEDLKAELMKLKKEELVEMLVKNMKADRVKIEDVVQPILADPLCSWLSLEDIASAVAERTGSNTSCKSVASYASKYPKEKGWVVMPRKSNSERMNAMKELLK